MSATAFTIESAKSASIRVIEDEARGTQAVHDMVTAMRANRRSGTACTKTRTEVAASGKKPWRQKGTGRARAGRVSSPIWRGGGIIFGPRPRSYAKSVNKRTKQLAFSKALSARILAGDVLSIDSFSIADGKTKSFVNQMSALGMPTKTIIISAAFDEKTYLAGRNVQKTLLMTAAEVNTEHLLYFDKIIITSDALQTIAARTGGNA